MVRRFLWLVQDFFVSFWNGDRHWGWLRLVFTLLVTLGMIAFGISLVNNAYGLTGFSFRRWDPRYWRSLVVPLGMFCLMFLIAARYIQDLYDLPGLLMGMRRLIASAFGLFYPRLEIKGGQRKLDPGERNLLQLSGGPGTLVIRPGSVVLLEELTAPTRALGVGTHFISRKERIKELISLEDQHGRIEATSATTKDGIPILVRDIQYRYRLRTGRPMGDYTARTPVDPYPFSPRAAGEMVYSRNVGSDGINTWDRTLQFTVERAIMEYITERQLDAVMTPDPTLDDPREKITGRMLSREVREGFKNAGAELLWFDIGHIDISDERLYPPGFLDEHRERRSIKQEMDAQRLKVWGARWSGSAKVERSYGEARRLALQELGRAEAQAELLESIMYALEGATASLQAPLGNGVDPAQARAQEVRNLRNLLLVRTAQILEALREGNGESVPLPTTLGERMGRLMKGGRT